MRQILETQRLILREFTLDDVERVHAILSDPVTMQFWPKPFDREGVERWIQRATDDYQDVGCGRYAVVLKSTGELIGDCGFKMIEINGSQENDLGYIIAKEFWGHGYATEAAQACLQFGFNELKMKRIVANMATNHLASAAVAKKIGLKLEYEFINPRNRDLPTYLMSLERKIAE